MFRAYSLSGATKPWLHPSRQHQPRFNHMIIHISHLAHSLERPQEGNIIIIVMARQSVVSADNELMQDYGAHVTFLPNGGGELLLSDRELHMKLRKESISL
jgi:hypothetical protein